MTRQGIAGLIVLMVALGGPAFPLAAAPLATTPPNTQPWLARTMPELEQALLRGMTAIGVAPGVLWIGADTNGHLTIASIFFAVPTPTTIPKKLDARAWRLAQVAFVSVPTLDEVHFSGVLPADGEVDPNRQTVVYSAAISRMEFLFGQHSVGGSEGLNRFSRVWYGPGSSRTGASPMNYQGGGTSPAPGQHRGRAHGSLETTAVVPPQSLHSQGGRSGHSPLRIIFQGDPTRHDVAVTFDDGPFPIYTTLVLDTLERMRLRATFFLVGEQVQRYPYFAQEIVKAGHEVGNHTFHHVRLSQLPEPIVEDEILRTQEVIADVTGQHPIYFRPPGGRFAFPVIRTASALGLTTVFWTANSGDYRHEGVPILEAKILGRVHPGGILLLHQGVGETTRVLPGVFEALRRHGLSFTTVSDLLNSPRSGSSP